MKGKKILKLPMPDHVTEGPTVGHYLRATLKALVYEGESFSGKMPLGDSDWDHQLAIALIEGGAIPGIINEWDEPEFKWDDFHEAMYKAVDAMEGK